MPTFDYILQGVHLTDTRWINTPSISYDGVWFLRPGMGVLPHFPGLRATTFTRPGQMGNTQVQYAPLESRTLELNVRILSVGTNPQHPRYGRTGIDYDEKIAFLEENVNELFFRTQIGKTSSGGHLNLDRVNNSSEHFPQGGHTPSGGKQSTVGRFLASAEPQMDDDARWVDYSLIFEIPQGTWWTDTQYRTISNVQAGRTTAIELPMGTAPVWDARIAIRSADPTEQITAGTRVVNEQGIGFQWGRNLNVGDWWRVVDCGERAYGGSTSNNGPAPDWDVALDNPTMVQEIGRPQGSLLHIPPGIAGSGARQGLIYITPTADIDVAVAIRPRWF